MPARREQRGETREAHLDLVLHLVQTRAHRQQLLLRLLGELGRRRLASFQEAQLARQSLFFQPEFVVYI